MLYRKIIITVIVSISFGSTLHADNWVWARKRAADLVSKMSLDEKAGLMDRLSKPVQRLGIPEHDWWNEALHGVARNGRATQFPQSICMAATWNPELIRQMTSAIGDEARAKHHSAPNRNKRYQGLTIWSPTINMARDPRWGRTEETYGEDPYLTGRMAVAFVKGLQGNDPKWLKTAATVKHFVANNSEYNRLTAAYPVPERDLREYYLPAFRAAVEDADVSSIMTAYNGINGIPCSVNKWLLTDVLKNTWGFNGAVVTDAGAGHRVFSAHHFTKSHVESVAMMIKAGVDNISDPGFGKYIKPAIKQGLLTEADVDKALTRNLAVRARLGQFDNPGACPYSKIPISVVGCKEHRNIAREIARQGIVLLKNTPDKTGAKVLPIDTDKVKTILVGGPYADIAQLGIYSGTPTVKPISPLDGIRELAARHNIRVVCWNAGQSFSAIPKTMLSPAETGKIQGLQADYFDNENFNGKPVTKRVDTSVDYHWPKPLKNVDPDIPQPVFAVRWTGFLKAPVSGEYTIRGRADDGMRVWLNGKQVFGNWDKKAVREVGRVKVTLEAGKQYPIKVEYFDIGGEAEAHLEWIVPQSNNLADYDPATTLAVYVCGSSPKLLRESHDRKDLKLRKFEEDDIRKLTERFPMTAVVLNGGGALAPLWAAEHTPAILDAWYPGQEGGTALAELLFGVISPSGKLPVTFYRSVKDLPDFGDYKVAGNGRTYMYFEKKPLWPFGHGLSYTTFEYSELKLSDDDYNTDETVKLKFKLSNTGKMPGDEVIQIYLRRKDGGADWPIRKLIAFRRVSLAPGKTRTVKFKLPLKDWARWNIEQQNWITEPGDYILEVGSSSADIRLTAEVKVDED